MKRLISGQKELLDFFNNLLDTILTENNNNNDDENEDENDDVNDDVNEDENEDVNEDVNEDDDVVENENDRETRQINYSFKTIDKSESFENQINLLKKIDYLSEFWNRGHYDDDKEINLKIFKLKFACVSNDVDKNLFEEVFGHKFVTLANKLINTTSKKENQIIINDLKKKQR